ncbi:MAG: 30S ribosomal protein S20 [Planctomycetia bacterium]|nr:30S ribosomal protein S20 [Planctomycetia bacterium]
MASKLRVTRALFRQNARNVILKELVDDVYYQPIVSGRVETTPCVFLQLNSFFYQFTMPNIQSAKKRQRQNAVRRERNRAARSVVRNRIKNLLKTLRAGDVEKVEKELFPNVCSALDRAANRGLWHKNNTSRKKSRLAKLIVKVKAQNNAG